MRVASTKTLSRRILQMSTKSLMIAAAVGLATLAGGVGAASAHQMGMGKSMGMSMMHHDFFRHDHGLRIIVGTGYSDCSYLYDKWLYTGDYFWKGKYFQCKYGYGW
jgi:hypothetical protein